MLVTKIYRSVQNAGLLGGRGLCTKGSLWSYGGGTYEPDTDETEKVIYLRSSSYKPFNSFA